MERKSDKTRGAEDEERKRRGWEDRGRQKNTREQQTHRQDDSDDDPVDGNGLTEDNRDQVLGANARSLDRCTHKRRPGGEDSPAASR